MGQKKYECICFEYAREDIEWLKNMEDASAEEQERPDFILLDGKEKVGLEHFLVDTQLNEKCDSHSRHKDNDIGKLYNRFRDGGYDRDPEGARQGIEDIVNEQLRTECNFNYQTFIESFKDVFNRHLMRVDEYRKQGISKLGFLMEFQVPQREYFVTEKNTVTHLQKLNCFPLTTDMWQVMSQFDIIDFLIITVIESADHKHSSYMIDKNSRPRLYRAFSLKNQGLPIRVKLNVEPDG